MFLNFSNPIKYSNKAVYSPNDKYFAITKSLDLIIYDTLTLKQLQKFSFSDYIEHIEWSKDSSLILIGLFKRGIVEIKQLLKPEWLCQLNEGIVGITHAYFAPDSRSVLTICNNNLKLSIWSLVNKTITYIPMPKYAKKGVSFTSNGHFMALAINTTPNDSIGVFYVGNWTQLHKFTTKCEDLQDVQWSYDNSTLLITDTKLVCRLYIYTPTGDLVNVIEPYEYKLGIRNVKLSPNGRFIGVGCYDQSVKMYYNVSYTLINEFCHNDVNACFANNKVNYFKEESVDSYYGGKTKYVSVEPPVDFIKSTSPMTNDVNPKMGVCKMEYSYDSCFLATRNDNMMNVVFIWELMGMNLHTVIIQLKDVTDFKWCPNQHVLFILTGTSKLFYFTLDSIFVMELPTNFTANTIQLNSDGRKFILNDPDYMIVGNCMNTNGGGYYEVKGSEEKVEEDGEGEEEGERNDDDDNNVEDVYNKHKVVFKEGKP